MTIKATNCTLVATIERITPTALLLRPEGDGAPDDSELISATLATSSLARPGDRGVVTFDDYGRAFVIGIVQPPRQERHIDELRDREGRTLVSHDPRSGVSSIHAQRDLVLAAPEGKIVLASRDGVGVTTRGAIVVQGGTRIDASAGSTGPGSSSFELSQDEIRLGSQRINASCEHSSLHTRKVSVSAKSVRADIGKLLVCADVVRQKARDVSATITGVLASHVGRVRQVVEGTLSLRTDRTVLRSRRDTKIDGEQIHLG